jgi:hypothetical protein
MKRPRIGKNLDKAMSQELDYNMPKKVRNNCKLSSCWVWDKTVNDFARENIIGKSINICAGLSDVGDVKVDLEPKLEGVIKADMNNLDYEDNSFDTVISDPPWKIGFFQRTAPFLECVRICKVGGRIIYNSTWKPISKYVKLESQVIRTDNNWSNVSVIWIFTKIADIEEKNSQSPKEGEKIE